MKPIVVQKYGGSSLADVERLRGVANRIIATKKRGYQVVAVVSAMGDSTDSLLEKARKVTLAPKKRELDMLLSAGERIAMSLLTMAIQDQGLDAISFTGSQCGIITSDSHANARIIDVRPVRILDELERDRIVIVAGYQGMSYKREVTTLGRGGSDTSAVAIAAALKAEYCEICSDVDGVYTSDPRLVHDARKIPELSYDEMEAMGVAGAGVLNPDAIEFARTQGMAVYLSATFQEGKGTLLLKTIDNGATRRVRAVTSHKKLHRIHLPGLSSQRHHSLLMALAEQRVSAEEIDWDSSEAGGCTIVLHPDRVPDWEAVRAIGDRISEHTAQFDSDTGSVSLIGARIGESFQIVAKALATLEEASLTVFGMRVLRDRITFNVACNDVQRGVRQLHRGFFPEEAKA